MRHRKNHVACGHFFHLLQNIKEMKEMLGPASTNIRAVIKPYRYGSAFRRDVSSSEGGARCWIITGNEYRSAKLLNNLACPEPPLAAPVNIPDKYASA